MTAPLTQVLIRDVPQEQQNQVVRVGMAQMYVEPDRRDKNLAMAARMIEQAADRECQFLVLPECMDLGWCSKEAAALAEPIDGPTCRRLADLAARHQLIVVAGLTERDGDRLFNAAVMLDQDGRLILHHRKISILTDVEGIYDAGDRLGVARTAAGVVGLNICADNAPDSSAQAHMLARMGACLILSPCAWAVSADHDNTKEPYGRMWLESYTSIAPLYELAIVGVSNVGPVNDGPWAGWRTIGCSLAVGPKGEVLARGRYGVDAQEFLVVDVPVVGPRTRGNQRQAQARAAGYTGAL